MLEISVLSFKKNKWSKMVVTFIHNGHYYNRLIKRLDNDFFIIHFDNKDRTFIKKEGENSIWQEK